MIQYIIYSFEPLLAVTICAYAITDVDVGILQRNHDNRFWNFNCVNRGFAN